MAGWPLLAALGAPEPAPPTQPFFPRFSLFRYKAQRGTPTWETEISNSAIFCLRKMDTSEMRPLPNLLLHDPSVHLQLSIILYLHACTVALSIASTRPRPSISSLRPQMLKESSLSTLAAAVRCGPSRKIKMQAHAPIRAGVG